MSKQSFVILTQTLHDRDVSGKRYPHGAIKTGRYKTWGRYLKPESNFKSAVTFINKQLNDLHIGGLVLIQKYIDGVPTKEITTLYQAKWGHDNKAFTQFQYAIGNYWKQRAKL
jgi:hypothetical protein